MYTNHVIASNYCIVLLIMPPSFLQGEVRVRVTIYDRDTGAISQTVDTMEFYILQTEPSDVETEQKRFGAPRFFGGSVEYV